LKAESSIFNVWIQVVVLFQLDIIDCHAHICPESLAEKNKEIIKRSSGITPAYDGSTRELTLMMKKSVISKVIVNNTVLRPELMSKANDFTVQVASTRKDLIGMAWIVPGEASSVQEVQRCKDLGFKGVKIHNSHFKILPTDPRNDKIYEKIVECKLPVLFHCGFNPYAKSGSIQYSAPKNFLEMISSFKEMKIILGHLGGYQDDPAGAMEAINASNSVFADTALDPDRPAELKKVVDQIGEGKIIFGSDYPIYDAAGILSIIRESLNSSAVEAICESNPKSIFSLD
jgi:uncharacterized protein